MMTAESILIYTAGCYIYNSTYAYLVYTLDFFRFFVRLPCRRLSIKAISFAKTQAPLHLGLLLKAEVARSICH